MRGKHVKIPVQRELEFAILILAPSQAKPQELPTTTEQRTARSGDPEQQIQSMPSDDLIRGLDSMEDGVQNGGRHRATWQGTLKRESEKSP